MAPSCTKSADILAPNPRSSTLGAAHQRLTLVHFSAQPEPFWSHLPVFPCLIDWGEKSCTQRIPQKALTLSRNVDECKPLPLTPARAMPPTCAAWT